VNTLTSGIVQRLQAHELKMTPTQEKICRFLLDHSVDVGYMSLKELSVKAEVSEVSILNFCSLLGFENYIAMRKAFRDDVRERMRLSEVSVVAGSFHEECDRGFVRYCGELMTYHRDMLGGFSREDLDRCAATIMESHNILVFGHDVSKIAADYLSSRLNYLHIRSQSVNLGNVDTVQMLVSGLTERDSVILFSFPPYYLPAVDVVRHASRCGARVIIAADSRECPAVDESCMFFPCRTNNPYFFNWMSVPIHFAEVLTFRISGMMGDKGAECIKNFKNMGSLFAHN